MNAETLLILLILLFAVFTQSLTGFGSALVAMAFLPGLIGLEQAAPLVALVAGTTELVLLLRYRQSLNWQAVWKLCLASLLGIPVGLLAVAYLPERGVLLVLGLVIAGYAAYGLLNFRLPKLSHAGWPFGIGFLAGFLGGAYNTSGPPVVVYASSQAWPPGEFKSNLQSFFLVNSTIVVLSHVLSRNITQAVWQPYLLALPVIAVGVLTGISLDRYLNPAVFRKAVLLLLVVMGLRLVLNAVLPA